MAIRELSLAYASPSSMSACCRTEPQRYDRTAGATGATTNARRPKCAMGRPKRGVARRSTSTGPTCANGCLLSRRQLFVADTHARDELAVSWHGTRSNASARRSPRVRWTSLLAKQHPSSPAFTNHRHVVGHQRGLATHLQAGWPRHPGLADWDCRGSDSPTKGLAGRQSLCWRVWLRLGKGDG